MKHYAVFGHPVAHSLSPRIHAAFGRDTGIPIDYLAIDADVGSFRARLEEFAARGGAGASAVRRWNPLPWRRRRHRYRRGAESKRTQHHNGLASNSSQHVSSFCGRVRLVTFHSPVSGNQRAE